MNKKIASILLLALVCFAGIALALVVAQTASISSHNPLSNQTVNITTHYPVELEINDTEGAARTFNVTVNQPVSVSWLINGTEVFSQSGVNSSEYEYNTTPFVIYGNIYSNEQALNLTVNITNLNTSESFRAKTVSNCNYYRLQSDSNHFHAGDRITINASIDGSYMDTSYIITKKDIKRGGLKQDFFGSKPDLTVVISDKSKDYFVEYYVKTFKVNYTVKNIGDETANASNTTIYIDGVRVWTDPVRRLAPGECYNNTVGPFNRPFDKKNVTIRVCADGDDAVNESSGSNNCMEHVLEFPVSDLKFHTHEVNGPDRHGEFSISIGVTREGEARGYVCESNVTFNITNIVLDNGSVSNISIKKTVKPLKGSWGRTITTRRYTCACNKEVEVTVCLDADNDIFESNENNNYWKTLFPCPASACLPDLVIVPGSVSGMWINRTNRTFTITYTVKNVGHKAANASTTSIKNTGFYCGEGEGTTPDVRFDQIPELAPGASHTSTVGPFHRLCKGRSWSSAKYSSIIKISVDCNNTVSEGDNENNNYAEYLFGLPYLYFDLSMGHWISGRNKTFRVEYRVDNEEGVSGATSNESTVYAYIDGNLSNVTDTVPPVPVGKWYHGRWGIGPLQMPPDKETVNYKLCTDRGDGVETCTDDVLFGGGACVAEDGDRFSFGGAWGLIDPGAVKIYKSCKFTGDVYYPDGILIGADDIVIDGNGTGILGDRSGCSDVSMDKHYKMRGIRNFGYDNVTIKNMDIRKFCNGIAIVNANNCTIENCSVHDNGVKNRYTYGITVVNSDNTTIDGCEVYNNTGILTDECITGGHGINFQDDSNYCAVTNSSIFNNYLSGIYASPTCKELYIGNNKIEENGYCGKSGLCAGVNLHWGGFGYGLTTNSTVENNVIQNNTGTGIYAAQGYTSIKDNIVKGSKNGTDVTVTGNGIVIEGGRITFVYNNTCCENEGMDIVNSESSFATYGDDNTCDTTSNYDDEGTRGCNFYCGGENGACRGKTKIFRCGDVVTESCTFNRSMSCRGCDGNGLIVGKDGITINGAGYALTGNFGGIGIFSNRKNVTIKNLQVEDFSTGIKIENVSANVIENCTVRTNLLTGINFSADNGTVRNSQIYDNNGTGIFVGGNYSIFENNTVARNKGYGIYFSPDARGNNITANFIGDNEDMDIYNDDGLTNAGDNNICDMAYNYRDNGMSRYNCTYPWTPPDLIISNKYEEWVDEEDARYNVTYTIENIGAPKSRPAERSTTYLYIRDAHAANDEVGPLKPGENYTRTFGYTPTIPDKFDKDRIKVCADGADEVEENNPANIFHYKDKEWYSVEDLFEDHEANNWLKNELGKSGVEDVIEWEDAACVAEDTPGGRIEYKCGDVVRYSCEFNGNMSCEGKKGLIIGADHVTINGKEQFAIGKGTGHGIRIKNHNNVRIENLKILEFDGDGIHMYQVDNSWVINNEIYRNTGAGESCEGSGNGIFMKQCCDNHISNNDIHNNRKGGIFMKDHPTNNKIIGNTIKQNGQAGIVLRCFMSNDNTIEGNDVSGNYGDGMFIGGNHNTIRNNIVNDNKDGHLVGDTIVEDGDGIDMGRNDGSDNNELYNNIVCGNAGIDIRTCGKEYRNTGDGNTCDTTKDYNDAGTTNCTYPCSGRALPDLVIADIRGKWVKGQEESRYEITYTVKNIGTANASESTTNLQILEGDNEIDYPVPALKPGDSHTHTFGPFQRVKTSDKITVTVNAGENRIDESNYDNNEKVYWFPPVLDKIIVSPKTARLKVAETRVFTATAYDQNGDPMEGIDISWSSSDEAVGDVSPPGSKTDSNGNATTVFTAKTVGKTTITAESGGRSGYATVTVWFEEPEEPEVPSFFRPGGGGRPPEGEENVTGYEPGPGAGTGEFGADIGGEQLPVNESETVSGGETRKSGHPFGMGGEIIETVKVVAPVFLIIMVVIFVALFYSGYFGEKRAHRRNKKRT